MKFQALFTSKDKSKKISCCLLQFLFGALRVKDFQSLKSGIALEIYSSKEGYLLCLNIYLPE